MKMKESIKVGFDTTDPVQIHYFFCAYKPTKWYKIDYSIRPRYCYHQGEECCSCTDDGFKCCKCIEG